MISSILQDIGSVSVCLAWVCLVIIMWFNPKGRFDGYWGLALYGFLVSCVITLVLSIILDTVGY